MADNPAPTGRHLMDRTTFKGNFGDKWPKETYLCYEVDVWKGITWAPVEEYQDFLRNQGADTHWEPRHAELCFLDRVHSWCLDEGKRYRFTCYISWSPCPDCAQKLVDFLGENSHVKLRIFAARIHSKFDGYEDGLRKLRAAGAQLAIMTRIDLEDCWEKFVDNQRQPFHPWTKLEKSIGAQCQRLENIFRNQRN